MNDYFARVVEAGFDDALVRVVEALKGEGFGVLTEIDVSGTLKEKLGVDFRKYRVLGACNPGLAHQALKAESKIGMMLPCNVVVQETDGGKTEVAAIDPRAAMEWVGNPALAEIADQVAQKLRRVVETV
ncbi:MAG: DUF302 domain-containing protein [Roseiarcus sp.]|jgi:uncharacterized protein (DUF302 family)